MARKIVITLFLFIFSITLTGCATRGLQSNKEYKQLAKSSSNPQVRKIYAVLPRYERLAQHTWPQIPYHNAIRPGKQSNQIPAIKQRLQLLGDLHHNNKDVNTSYSPQVVMAIKRFQGRHGIDTTGVIGKQTIEALNITPYQRITQLLDSMKRWAKIPSLPNDQYIHVNVPSYQLNVVKDKQSVLSMRVVVGQPKWPTPELTSSLKTIVVNPAWNVPRNITEREIVHAVAKDPNYLVENDLTVYKNWQKDTVIDPALIDWQQYTGKKDLPYLLSQDPGEKNALGMVKFIFPNEHDVYLHDTQAKSLFSRDQRNFSHGCVRLEKPLMLYQYLISQNSEASQQKASIAMQSGKTKHFRLKQEIPIYLTYITAWVDDQGHVEFAKDIYNKL
ncbi:MAG: L,D-transpeptidase family protein [Coxiellaceae bacterium]|nr:L,D-transpeptidase family protein [Coxiellaceae bacterium]